MQMEVRWADYRVWREGAAMQRQWTMEAGATGRVIDHAAVTDT